MRYFVGTLMGKSVTKVLPSGPDPGHSHNFQLRYKQSPSQSRLLLIIRPWADYPCGDANGLIIIINLSTVQ